LSCKRLSSLSGRRVQPLRRQSIVYFDQLFGPLLPAGWLSQRDEGPNSREQIYSVRRTFFGFLHQVPNPDCACREGVRRIQALFALVSPRPVSDATGAYCVARGRLPLDTLARLRCVVAAQTGQAGQLWKDFRVTVVAGTGIGAKARRAAVLGKCYGR